MCTGFITSHYVMSTSGQEKLFREWRSLPNSFCVCVLNVNILMKSFELKYSFLIENCINIFKIINICVTFLSVSVQLVYQCSKGISKMYYLGFCFFYSNVFHIIVQRRQHFIIYYDLLSSNPDISEALLIWMKK